ncbi:alpha/beta hydrolase [Streptomyces sp. NPDC003401]
MNHLTLKILEPTEYAEAAAGYRAISRTADAAVERIDKQITAAMRKANEGEAADAALKQLRKLSENFHYTQVECGLITGALDGFSSEITAPKRRLNQALDDAVALAYTVNEDGTVTYPAGGKNELTGDPIPGGTVLGNNGLITRNDTDFSPPGLVPNNPQLKNPNPHHAKAVDIADRIAHAVREAKEIDDRYSKALNKLKAPPGLNVDTRTWADAASDVDAVSSAATEYLQDHIPLDKSPADRKEWWDSLSDEERQEYKAAFPEVIGNLDGIPAVDRDEVNRENLQMLIAKLSGQHDENSREQLAGMKGIEDKLSKVSNPPMLLLGIGDQGNGRAIVSYGNPDTSKNVSAYVPGLGTTLNADFADDTLQRGLDTAKGARLHDPSSAAIVWLGYDAPDFAGVASTTNAENGAPAYNGFMDGIAATNRNENPHITAIGHSYGSLTVGTAARQDGGIPGADDIILLGSPGVGVDKASELNVGKGHVFVGSAGNDPVTWLPSKPQVVAGLMGGILPGALADPGGDDVWFGKDPASEAFGATRFRVSDGPLPFYLAGIHEGPTPAHSDYFTPTEDQESADNIARIVAGKSGSVTTEMPR